MSRAAWFLAVLLAFVLGCGGSSSENHPSPSPEPRTTEEEPLETATIEGEEIVPIETPREEPPSPTAARRRPCAWARAWRNPDAPNPLLAGVGGVPMPEKVESTDVRVPAGEPAPSGEVIVELVIGPEGAVEEAAIVQGFDPRWPDGEEAILTAVRKWRYRPPRLDGTPISVCSTVVVRL